MTPATLDLDIVRGLTFDAITIICKTAMDVVVPIPGWKAYAGAKNTAGDYLDFPISVTNPGAGEITMAEMEPTFTAGFGVGEYIWHLALEDATGDRSGPYLTGTVTVTDLNVKLPNV